MNLFLVWQKQKKKKEKRNDEMKRKQNTQKSKNEFLVCFSLKMKKICYKQETYNDLLPPYNRSHVLLSIYLKKKRGMKDGF